MGEDTWILRMVRPWAGTAGRVGLPGSLATWLHMTRRLLIGPKKVSNRIGTRPLNGFLVFQVPYYCCSGMCVCLALPLDTQTSSPRRGKSRMLVQDLPALGSKPSLSALCDYPLSTQEVVVSQSQRCIILFHARPCLDQQDPVSPRLQQVRYFADSWSVHSLYLVNYNSQVSVGCPLVRYLHVR